MGGMPAAPAAVLAQLDALGIVALAFVRLVIPALAVLAGEGHSDPDISAGHILSFATGCQGWATDPQALSSSAAGATSRSLAAS
jgi:hypothetical protein